MKNAVKEDKKFTASSLIHPSHMNVLTINLKQYTVLISKHMDHMDHVMMKPSVQRYKVVTGEQISVSILLHVCYDQYTSNTLCVWLNELSRKSSDSS